MASAWERNNATMDWSREAMINSGIVEMEATTAAETKR